MKRKRDDCQGGRLQLKLRKTAGGLWQEDRVGIKLTRNELGLWETEMDDRMDPLRDLPEFDESFRKMIRPAVRKSRRQRKNIPDDVPTPPPSSSSDEDIFKEKIKKKKKIVKRRK